MKILSIGFDTKLVYLQKKQFSLTRFWSIRILQFDWARNWHL